MQLKSRAFTSSLGRVSGPARVQDAKAAVLAVNNLFLLQLLEQLVHGLAAEREHYSQALLRNTDAI
jgi:hypothetical protein